MTSRFITAAAMIGSFALLVCSAAHAEDAAAVFARFKDATGGVHWDGVRSLHETGALAAGGLNGSFQAIVDARSGRSSSSYKIGPVDGANGFDGTVGWNRAPGGEVATLDAPAAIRNARSQAWLDAHGYWYRQTLPAALGPVESRTLGNKAYRVVVATPAGGNPVTLWFASDSGLLARTQQPQDGYVVTTVFDDYRAVDGVRLPFHSAVDQTDAAGRTDPRSHEDIRLSRVDLNAPIADADFAAPKMAATARIDDTSGVTRVPFDLVNNHIYVDGFVDGKPVRFLVDTGGSNLLTPAAAKRLGLAAQGKMAASGAGDNNVDLAMARAKQVRVGAATLDNPVFIVIDLGNLPQIEGAPLDGLVGYEMFRRFGVQIDYAKHELTLSDPKAFVPPPGATVLPFTLSGTIPIIAGSLDGLPVKLSVDTGSRESLTLSSPFVKVHDLVAKYAAAPETVTGWGVGGAARGRPARLGRLQLGGLAIDGIAGDLFTGDKGAFADPNVSGNLGGGVLHRFTVAFDYANKKMYLAPNAAFGKPDDFDRSGLWLLGDGDALKVVDVANASAAQSAGLKDGDRILAIGGEAITAHSLADWRARLRTTPAGTHVALRFVRDGKEQSTDLVLANRIPDVAQP